ncbi:unnamed protein product [Miscanthus lutarioriparius]|uniref:Uncharacterized protein n=1 Tax=Miscanthus lutarioriparius TaxID=422564 RepID=A0A811MEV5_9POAL|nr:unnamed protein product [Miscanthus lutarioriparius]
MWLSPRLPLGVAGAWFSVLHAAWGTGEAPWRASERLGQVRSAVSRWPPDAALGFHPTLRLRIEQLRPPCPESFREGIVFDFPCPASLKVEGPRAVAQWPRGPAPRRPQQSRPDGHARVPRPGGSFSPDDNGRLPRAPVLTPGANSPWDHDLSRERCKSKPILDADSTSDEEQACSGCIRIGKEDFSGVQSSEQKWKSRAEGALVYGRVLHPHCHSECSRWCSRRLERQLDEVIDGGVGSRLGVAASLSGVGCQGQG